MWCREHVEKLVQQLLQTQGNQQNFPRLLGIVIENPLVIGGEPLFAASRLHHHVLAKVREPNGVDQFLLNTCTLCNKVYGVQLSLILSLDTDVSYEKISELVNHVKVRSLLNEISGIGYTIVLPECLASYACTSKELDLVSKAAETYRDSSKIYQQFQRRIRELQNVRENEFAIVRGGILVYKTSSMNAISEEILRKYSYYSYKSLSQLYEDPTIVKKPCRNEELAELQNRLQNVLNVLVDLSRSGRVGVFVIKVRKEGNREQIDAEELRNVLNDIRTGIDTLIGYIGKGLIDPEAWIEIQIH